MKTAGCVGEEKMSSYDVMLAGPGETRAVLDFVTEHFIPHEPINAAIKLVEPGYRMPYFDSWLESQLILEDTVTVVARDSQTGQMLGVCILEMERIKIKASSPQPAEPNLSPSYSVCPEKLKKIFTFLDWMKEDLDVARDYGVEEWADVMILACRSDLRTPGLGTELVRRGLEIMEERGVKVFTGTATSHYSARIFSKLGFTTLKECLYEDYKVDDGHILFPPSPPHISAKQFIKT